MLRKREPEPTGPFPPSFLVALRRAQVKAAALREQFAPLADALSKARRL
jgi:hypothetical protein